MIKPIEKIHAAAFHFAFHSRYPDDIKKYINVSDRTVRR